MAGFDIWDVVKVPYPYTNRPVQQRRPALVVVRHGNPGSPALLWVLMITSAGHRAWRGDVGIGDLASAGLPAASLVRTVKIATIEAGDAAVIGRLGAADRLRVGEALAAALAAAVIEPAAPVTNT